MNSVPLMEYFDISINLMASATSSFSTTLTNLKRANAVDNRNIANKFRADVKVRSLLLRASFLICTYDSVELIDIGQFTIDFNRTR